MKKRIYSLGVLFLCSCGAYNQVDEPVNRVTKTDALLPLEDNSWCSAYALDANRLAESIVNGEALRAWADEPACVAASTKQVVDDETVDWTHLMNEYTCAASASICTYHTTSAAAALARLDAMAWAEGCPHSGGIAPFMPPPRFPAAPAQVSKLYLSSHRTSCMDLENLYLARSAATKMTPAWQAYKAQPFCRYADSLVATYLDLGCQSVDPPHACQELKERMSRASAFCSATSEFCAAVTTTEMLREFESYVALGRAGCGE